MAKTLKHIIFVVGLTIYSITGNTQSNNKQDSIYLEKINIEIAKSFQRNNIEEAIAYALDAKDLAEKTFGKNSNQYIKCLNNLVILYDNIGNYLASELLCKELLIIHQRVFGDNDAEYANCLNFLGMLYFKMGNYEASESFYGKAIKIRKKVLGENNLEYAGSLNNYALLYETIGNYSLAETLYNDVLKILKKTSGENNPEYATALTNLAVLYTSMGNYVSAEIFHKEALNIRKKIFGENNLEYANSLNNMAGLLSLKGNYRAAVENYQEAKKILKRILGENHPNYATCLNNIASFYSDLGNYSAADTLYKEVLAIRKKTLGTNHPDYATSLNNMADLYQSIGNYKEAEALYKQALLIRKNIFGTEHRAYASSLNNLASLYSDLGNYSTADSLYKMSLAIRKKILGENHPDHGSSLNNLASISEKLGNYSTADSLYKMSIAISKKIKGKNHPDYAAILNNLANLNMRMGNFKDAEILNNEALFIYKKVFGNNHPDYALSLNISAKLNENMNNINSSEKLYNEAIVINKKILGEMHPTFAIALINLAGFYYNTLQYNKWIYQIAFTIKRENNNHQILINAFSENEKEIYLRKESTNQQAFHSMLHYFKPQSTNSFYQSTTSKQGWLLNGKQQLTQFANQSKDTSVKNLLTQWQNTNRQYAQAIQLTIEKRKLNNINVDSLQEQSQQLEKQLIAAMPALQAVIVNNGFTGKDVAAKLKPKEAVVHWVSFQYKSPKQWTDSVLYAAYIITPNDTAPKFITVFEEKQLQQILKNYHASANARSTIKKDSSTNTNADIALYNLIWKPLLPYLQNATTIYNLPAGLLHKISFAALTDSSNKSLIDTYEIHQLLSINELVNPLKITNNNNTIALFGGANYDAVNTTTSTSSSIAQAPLYRNASDNINIQFNYLQGTKTEVETVATNAKNTNWKTQSYTGNSATEDNFKTIGGENAPKILHIATHGFYFPPTKTKPNNFITDDKNSPRDFPLLRSGLVLSGANNYWGKDTLLENQEDGIVTAQEISNLNLLNTDLVVLSACQTALGDINGSEGVYGLQRAFKMAGVKKLLMSLWEVPDAETAELMQLFYSNVFKGETYYTAFRKAQLALKAKYKDPTKWAGFVLVGE
jgi:CHAT domain-containing protein